MSINFSQKKNFTNTHTTSQSRLKCAHMHQNPMKQVDLFCHSKVFHRALAIIVIINDNCTKCHFTYYTLFTLVCAVFSIVCPYKTHIWRAESRMAANHNFSDRFFRGSALRFFLLYCICFVCVCVTTYSLILLCSALFSWKHCTPLLR